MAQFARPDSDITTTNWTGGFANIDEASFSDADFAWSANNTGTSPLEVGLSNISDPFSSTGHIIRCRFAKTNSGVLDGGGSTVNGIVELFQGATLIRSHTEIVALTGGFQSIAVTLTATEANAITNYNDLRLVFRYTGGGGSPATRRGMAVSWAEFETPDAGVGPTGQIKTYDGADFVAKPVKVWNGSSWEIKPVKFWDGNSWEITQY